MVDGSDESHDGYEKQEEAHSYDPTDDVDARHDAKLLPPCCHAYQQQTYQLRRVVVKHSELLVNLVPDVVVFVNSFGHGTYFQCS